MDKQALWALVPALDLVDLTLQTCLDLLAQSIPVRVLLIDQGSSEESNDQFRQFAEQHHPRVLLWSFNPPLPSLSGAWNRGLAFVWSLGVEEALVVNSDVRLRPDTASMLRTVMDQTVALFVSAVGVGEQEFTAAQKSDAIDLVGDLSSKGGPDYSCFLLSRAGHQKYPFDEAFIPCFGEDCSNHREYMLGGDGSIIFSVNLPFHHIGGGSRTINQSPEARARFEKIAGIAREHYRRSWGGGPNQETYTRKGDPSSAQAGVTTPELQARVQAGLPALSPPYVMPADSATQFLNGCDRELEGAEEIAAVETAFRKQVERIKAREDAAGTFEEETF